MLQKLPELFVVFVDFVVWFGRYLFHRHHCIVYKNIGFPNQAPKTFKSALSSGLMWDLPCLHLLSKTAKQVLVGRKASCKNPCIQIAFPLVCSRVTKKGRPQWFPNASLSKPWFPVTSWRRQGVWNWKPLIVNLKMMWGPRAGIIL